MTVHNGTFKTTFEVTHPWITFKIAEMMARAPAKFWMSLGEARSKCQHLAGVPLKPNVAAELHNIYLARGVLATAAIEGNTLTEKEARAIIEKKSELPESQAYLEREIQNILQAANGIMDSVERHGPASISPADIKAYNKQVLTGLEVADYVVPGECVQTDIAVAGYHGAPWQECEFLLDRLCEWLNGTDFASGDDNGLAAGILKAIVAHVYVAWIHPFGDGNGRTARLLEVRFLTEAGVPSAAAHLLSNFYNKTRTEYYKRLDEASKNGGNLIPFMTYALGGFVDLLREQIKLVKQQQWHVSWENFVYQMYEGRNSAAEKRQRKVVLALTDCNELVPKSRIRKLTPELAEIYAGKTDRTVTRDLIAMRQLGLIERTRGGYRAKMELMLAFLPRGRKGNLAEQVREALLDVPSVNGQLPLPV